MKSTGIVRPVDNLGRIVLPIELRRTMDLAVGDPLEIFVDGENIVLRKYAPGCIICGSLDELRHVRGKLICRPCAATAVGA